MKKTLRLAVALAALAVATSASAQQRPMVGLGVSFSPIAASLPLNAVAPVEIYVPISIAPQFRLEPSLGIWTIDEDGGNEESAVSIGIGGFFVKRVAAPADVYFGARLKLNRTSVDTGAADDSGTDLVFAGAAGGEYHLAPQFSLGLEAQLGLYSLGDVSGDADGFFTNGLAFLRFYF